MHICKLCPCICRHYVKQIATCSICSTLQKYATVQVQQYKAWQQYESTIQRTAMIQEWNKIKGQPPYNSVHHKSYTIPTHFPHKSAPYSFSLMKRSPMGKLPSSSGKSFSLLLAIYTCCKPLTAPSAGGNDVSVLNCRLSTPREGRVTSFGS